MTSSYPPPNPQKNTLVAVLDKQSTRAQNTSGLSFPDHLNLPSKNTHYMSTVTNCIKPIFNSGPCPLLPTVPNLSLIQVPAGSPSHGGDVVYVKNIHQPSLSTPFYSVLVSISFFMALSKFIPLILPITLCFLILFFQS